MHAGFATSYSQTAGGLPPEVIHGILTHEVAATVCSLCRLTLHTCLGPLLCIAATPSGVVQALQVQCEAQVLLFILDYVDSTQLEASVAAQLFQHVGPSPGSQTLHALRPHAVPVTHCPVAKQTVKFQAHRTFPLCGTPCIHPCNVSFQVQLLSCLLRIVSVHGVWTKARSTLAEECLAGTCRTRSRKQFCTCCAHRPDRSRPTPDTAGPVVLFVQ